MVAHKQGVNFELFVYGDVPGVLAGGGGGGVKGAEIIII